MWATAIGEPWEQGLQPSRGPTAGRRHQVPPAPTDMAGASRGLTPALLFFSCLHPPGSLLGTGLSLLDPSFVGRCLAWQSECQVPGLCLWDGGFHS